MNSSLKEVTPPEAWLLIQDNENSVLLDVRTSMEFEYVGHPLNAINLPWMEAPEWTVNTEFYQQVKAMLSQKHAKESVEQLPVFLICRSGKRSESAANCLLEGGFTNVYNVIEGFEGDRNQEKHRNTVNGWRFHNLPWEQS